MEVSPSPWDHNYCKLSSNLHERGGRLAVTKFKKTIQSRNSFHTYIRICHIKGKTEMGLFASRLSAQFQRYIAWKPDPYSQVTDAMQQIWSNQYLYAFPPFSMINKVLRKIAQVLTVAPTWQSQVWYPTLLRMSVEKPLLLPHQHLLLKHQAQIHPLITNRTLRSAVWMVPGKGCLQQEFQRGLPSLFRVQGDKVHYQIAIRSGQNGLPGVVKEKLIHFDVL